MHIGQVAVPDHVGLLEERDRDGFRFRIQRIEEAKLYARGMFGKNGEVDADAIPCGAEWIRRPWPDANVVLRHR